MNQYNQVPHLTQYTTWERDKNTIKSYFIHLIIMLSARSPLSTNTEKTVPPIDWPQSLMSIFFSKTDNLSKIAIYKVYLEVEVLGLDH